VKLCYCYSSLFTVSDRPNVTSSKEEIVCARFEI
jgi:hypothetical protein